MKTLNRRDFLKTSGAAALFAATPGLAFSQVVGGGGSFTLTTTWSEAKYWPSETTTVTTCWPTSKES